MRHSDPRSRPRLFLAWSAALLLAHLAGPASANDFDPLRFGEGERFIALSPVLQLDGGWASSSPRTLLDGSERAEADVRRARMYVDYGFDRLGGRVVVDFSDLDGNAVPYAWIDWDVQEDLTLRLGQQNVPFTFQEILGSRAALFAEDAVSSTFQQTDSVGAALLWSSADRSVSVGAFGTNVNERAFGDGYGFAARGTYAPHLTERSLLHLGAAVQSAFDRREAFSFSGGTGSPLVSSSLVSTDEFASGSRTLAGNLEMAATRDRLTLQGEYAILSTGGGDRRDALLHGGYIGALVFLTNDHRGYDAGAGVFEQVSPRNGVREGGGGAVEIGLRFDYLDLTDGGGEAGAQMGATGVLNWYLDEQIRLTASHAYSRVTSGLDRDENVNTTLLRAAFIY